MKGGLLLRLHIILKCVTDRVSIHEFFISKKCYVPRAPSDTRVGTGLVKVNDTMLKHATRQDSSLSRGNFTFVVL